MANMFLPTPFDISNNVVADSGTIEGDMVYWENEWARLEVTPHTSKGLIRQTQYANITWKASDMNVDFAFRFDEPLTGEKDIWYWQNNTYNIYTPVYGNISKNYTITNITDFTELTETPSELDWGDIPSDKYYEGTLVNSTVLTIGFDSMEWLNPEHTSAKFYYHIYGYMYDNITQGTRKEWVSHKGDFQHTQHNGKHYYYTTNNYLKQGNSYQAKWQYNIPINQNGKWDLFVKPSSETIAEVLANGHYCMLDPWFSSDYTYKKSINISASLVQTDLANFPILINITDTDLRDDARDDGFDIAFTDSTETTQLNHEIERFDGSTGELLAWVNVTKLSGDDDTQIYMYYGDADATDQSDAANTWDSNYMMVQHFNASSQAGVDDSTANNNDADADNNMGYKQPGVVGYGVEYVRASDSYITVPDSATLDTTITTIEMFVNYDTSDSVQTTMSKANTGGGSGYLINGRKDIGGGTRSVNMQWGDGTWPSTNFNANKEFSATGYWYHNAFVIDGSWDTTIYVDGEAHGSAQDTDAMATNNEKLNLGRNGNAGSNSMDGLMDEVRISNIARNLSWINTTYKTITDNTNFITVGNEETETAANNAPTLSSETPTNTTSGVGLYEPLSITINDADGDSMTVNWYWGADNTVPNFMGRNTTAGNGTYYFYDNNNDQNFSKYSNKYYWKVSVTDGTDTTEEVYHFTTDSNSPPVQSGENPSNNSAGQPLTLTWNITIEDPDGDTFNWTIECNNGDTNSGNGDTNGSKSLSISGLSYSTEYTVFVNATDLGTGNWTNATYNFTTGSGSAPTFSAESPVNASTNRSITPTLSITVNDADGDSMDVSWYWGTDSSCPNFMQRNESVNNGTYYFNDANNNSNFSSYQTTYYWKVYASDGTNSNEEIYHFETTPYRTLYFNDTFPNENYITTSKNMTHQTGWENYTSGGGNYGNLIIEVEDGDDDASSYANGDNFNSVVDTLTCFPYSDSKIRRIFGIVYKNVSVPQGATIVSSSLKVFTHGDDINDDPYLWIELEDNDSSLDFGDYANISARPRTTSNTSWQESNIGTAEWVFSPDISSAIQEVIDRPGWVLNNNMTVIFNAKTVEDQTDKLIIRSYEREDPTPQSKSAELYVNYTTNPGHIRSVEIHKPSGYYWDKFYADVNDTEHCSFALSDNLTDYNITSGLTGNGDDISSLTNDSLYIFGNFSNVNVAMASWNITWKSNAPPSLTNENPTDGEAKQSLSFTWNVTIEDPDGDTFNWTIECNNSNSNSANGDTNGSKTLSISGLEYGVGYTVYVNATDGTEATNESYTFIARTEYTPTNPTNFAATKVNRTSIQVTWTKGTSNVSHTRIEWNTAADGSWSVGDHNLLYNGTGTSVYHNGLDPGTNIHYQGFSYNDTDNLYSSGSGATDDATTDTNTVPALSNEDPTNLTTGVSITYTQLSIDINDADGDTFNWTIESTSGDTNSGNGDTNGTYTCSLSTLSYLTEYTWYVNVTDGFGSTNESFNFTTDSQTNSEPSLTNENPSNNSAGQPLTFTWNVTIEDPDGDTFNWTIECDNGNSSSANGDTNGSKTLVIKNLDKDSAYNVYVNATDLGTGNWTNASYSFETVKNNATVLSGENPANQSTGQAQSLTWNITIEDPDGDTFNWTIECNNGDTNSSNTDTNGSKELDISGLINNTQYTVFVNVTDSYVWTNETFIFTTQTGTEPPTVTTSDETGVEETNATLGGNLVNGQGEICDIWVQYGTTTAYGLKTTNQSATSGTFSSNVAGLTAGTLYHFRARANNSNGVNSGIDKTFITKPNASTNLVVSTTNFSIINISWTAATDLNTTYVERNTESSWARGTGTEVYNGTNASFDDTGLTNNTLYYYQAWSYAEWTNNGTTLFRYSDTNLLGSNTTWEVGVPTNGDTTYYSEGRLKLEWSKGQYANRSWLVRNATQYPQDPTDGTVLLQNGTDFYNDYTTDSYYYTVFGWNSTANLYSNTGLELAWGLVNISVYREDEPNIAIGNYTVFITNEDRTETYEQTDSNNFVLIGVDAIPNGDDTIIKITKEGYKSRTQYWDLSVNNQYEIVFYLPPDESGSPSDESDEEWYVEPGTNENDLKITSQSVSDASNDLVITLDCVPYEVSSVEGYNESLYGHWFTIPDDKWSINSNIVTVNNTMLDENTTNCRVSYYCDVETGYAEHYIITVQDELGDKIGDVFVEIKRYINTTDEWAIVLTEYTDSAGQQEVDLMPDALYLVNLTHSSGDYVNISETWSPPEIVYSQDAIKTYILEFTEPVTQYPDNPAECIDIDAEIEGTVLFVNFSNTCNFLVDDIQIYVYMTNLSTENTSLFSTNSTTNTIYYNTTQSNINNSNTYTIVVYYNTSHWGTQKVTITIRGTDVLEPDTTAEDVDNMFDALFGGNPFGWHNILMFLFFVVAMFYADNRDVGKVLILIGGMFLFISAVVIQNSDIGTVAGGIIPIIFIIGGIIKLWNDHNKR